MSAPVLWIFIPALAAAALFFVRKWERAVIIFATLFAAGLAWLGWFAPIGERLPLGPVSFELTETLNVLGRRFILDSSDRPVLVFIYLAAAFWFAGSGAARVPRLFIPMALGIAALLTATLAVEPFLYAALFIEMAALLSIPLLSYPGKAVGRGALRFLTFQTMGMPFLLFAGWLLTTVEAIPGDPDLIFRANILIGLGFAFFLGIFPFHTWIPMLAQEAHPYATAFVLFILPLAISLFGLDFLERFAWLSSSTDLYALLRSTGALMAIVGGLWAAFQRHLGRMMGYAVMVEIGLSLLALGTAQGVDGSAGSLEIFFALLLPRALGLSIWALALVVIQSQAGELRFRSVKGLARRLPIAAAGVILAQFSLAGFPLLAGFPAHFALWEGLAREYPIAALAALFGTAGILVGGLRTLAVLVMGPDEQGWQVLENWGQRVLLVAGGLALFTIGLLPQWFFPVLIRLADGFIRPGP